MLFSSQVFLLLFLPVALGAYYLLATSCRQRLVVLILTSMLFYAWWDPRFLPLLIGTILTTWIIVVAHERFQRKWILAFGVFCNLAALACFKYANFFAESALSVIGIHHEPWGIILPLGISFFTFQQVSYLIDRYRGSAPMYGVIEYTAFVSFFPQLIAGPIVRHNQLIPQFKQTPRRDGLSEHAARGLVLFVLGLVKKVFFADELAPLANLGFDAAASGDVVASADAWLAALAYSLQLYFDFSAYSDMAMGLAALFGLSLPLNFDVPYRACDIRAFWRSWHMTLSSFLRDYVYIPLGGSRGGMPNTYWAVMVTMLLCGLWHGAGWTFIVWGCVHGLAICVNRAWVACGGRLPSSLAWLVTMSFVVAAWVLFRAEDFASAAAILTAMSALHEFSIIDIDTDDLIYVLLGAVFAVLGPSNVAISQARGLLRPTYAYGAGFLLFLVTLRVGQGRGLEFIYFQF